MAKARRYQITLIGETPLLMKHDNLEWGEVLDEWRKDPANKAKIVKGDDRSPAWSWIGGLYVEGGKVVIPADNLMTLLREGGKKYPTGKGQQTFKAQTQSGIVIDQSSWPILVAGAEVPYSQIKALINEHDFEKHKETCEELGFELFVKRAKIGAAKHVRVRPRFDNWVTTGTLTVFDDAITKTVLEQILKMAGAYCGLCDWRPSSPKAPGPYGKFSVEIKEMK